MSLHVHGEGVKNIKTNEHKNCANEAGCTTKLSGSEDVSSDNFRCEKFRDGGLVELKSKMLENCDLNRPFSSSLSLFAAEETYLYCCHKK